MISLVACGGEGRVVSAPLPPEARAAQATTTCFQGVSSGVGQRVQTMVRRVVDPAAKQIVEDVVHADASGARRFHVVMAVEGARFTMTEAASGVTGTGTLVGEAWRWTSATSKAQMPGGIEVASQDEITATARTARKEIRKDGAVVGTIVDELTAFDCAGWDDGVAQLAVVRLDDALCEQACRQFATLKFWAAAAGPLAAMPAADRDEARRGKAAELAASLEARAPACVAQCRAANNAAQTACIARAASVEQLGACEAK